MPGAAPSQPSCQPAAARCPGGAAAQPHAGSRGQGSPRRRCRSPRCGAAATHGARWARGRRFPRGAAVARLSFRYRLSRAESETRPEPARGCREVSRGFSPRGAAGIVLPCSGGCPGLREPLRGGLSLSPRLPSAAPRWFFPKGAAGSGSAAPEAQRGLGGLLRSWKEKGFLVLPGCCSLEPSPTPPAAGQKREFSALFQRLVPREARFGRGVRDPGWGWCVPFVLQSRCSLSQGGCRQGSSAKGN